MLYWIIYSNIFFIQYLCFTWWLALKCHTSNSTIIIHCTKRTSVDLEALQSPASKPVLGFLCRSSCICSYILAPPHIPNPKAKTTPFPLTFLCLCQQFGWYYFGWCGPCSSPLFNYSLYQFFFLLMCT